MSDQLRSIFARWLALELNKAEISDGMKDLFAEAKGNGYDTKALRLAFRTHVKDSEPESDADRATRALVETYLTDLAEKPLARPAPARVEKIEEFRPAAPVKAAAETSPEPGMAPRGQTPIATQVMDRDRRNVGGYHALRLTDTERGEPRAAEGGTAREAPIRQARSPADGATLRGPSGTAATDNPSWQMDEDIPANLDRRIRVVG